MLRAKHIPRVLEKVNAEGILSSMLMLEDGSLLGTAGEWPKGTKGDVPLTDEIIGALSSNMWGEFKACGESLGLGDMHVMLLELDQGRLGVAGAGDGYLVCVFAEKRVKLGLIKVTLEALHHYFSERLRHVARDETRTAA
jgi:predicted regulator of Ras-like GTPase activity (Roadblock/LC7/MglB family)